MYAVLHTSHTHLPVDDTLDSLLAGSDDEAEEDAVVNQVLDEIGIDIQKKVTLIILLFLLTLCYSISVA